MPFACVQSLQLACQKALQWFQFRFSHLVMMGAPNFDISNNKFLQKSTIFRRVSFHIDKTNKYLFLKIEFVL
jgi:hypothetical protein